MSIGSWRRSGEITAQTWGVIRENRQLLRFPLLAAGWGIAVAAIFMVPAAIVAALSDDLVARIVAVALVAFGTWAATFVGIRYMAGLVYVADKILKGEPATFDEGMEAVKEHNGALGLWALITVVVGWILSMIQGGGDDNVVITIIRAILAGLLAAAWSLVTFFVLPVIMLEQATTPQAMKRSVSLIKNRWGEAVVGSFRIGLRVALVFILPGLVIAAVGVALAVAIGGVAGVISGGVLVLGGVALMVVGMVRQAAARQVFGVALYRYAADGTVVGPFAEADLAGAVRPKKKAKSRG
jgi:hypothetical protein